MVGSWCVNQNPHNTDIVEISNINEYGEGFAFIVQRDKYQAETSLISAAPELLEVCECFAERSMHWIDEVPFGYGLYEQLIDAIAKAKGAPQ